MPTAEIFIAAHRAVMEETRRCVVDSKLPFRLIVGVSDTALARNLTLTQALTSDAEVIVMVDDDMTIPPPAMHKLIEIAHREQMPTSALYLTGDHKAAAFPLKESDDWKSARWVTGLGCLAIPKPALEALAANSERLRGANDRDDVIAFCWSGAGNLPHDKSDEPRRWLSEDYCLTLRLGGCLLAPIGVGHLKPLNIWPSQESLEKVRAGHLDTAEDKAAE